MKDKVVLNLQGYVGYVQNPKVVPAQENAGVVDDVHEAGFDFLILLQWNIFSLMY